MMTKAPGKSWLWITLSILIAAVLAVLPLPLQLLPFRPDWILMVVIYWCLALPHRANVGVAWMAGLLLDLLLGSTLGVRGLAMSIVIYIAALNHLVIRNLSVWQQAIVVGLLSILFKVIVFWAEHAVSDVNFQSPYFWSVLSTMLIWPWVFLILRKLRRHYRMS